MVAYQPSIAPCNCGLTACNCARCEYSLPTINYTPDPNDALIKAAENILRDMPCCCVRVKAGGFQVVSRKCQRCRAIDALSR